MNRKAIHDMVEYIRTQSEFPFDGIDVEDSLDDVLAYFGLHPQLEDDERQQLREDLLPFALQDELAEVSQLAESELWDGLVLVKDDPHKRRCTPEGVHFFTVSLLPDQECTGDMRQGVSLFNGENAP